MAVSTSVNEIGWLKNNYANFYRSQETVKPMLLEKLQKGQKTYDGRGRVWIFGALMEGGESVGAGREGGVLPGGPTGSTGLNPQQASVATKINYMSHSVTGLFQAQSEASKASFLDGLDEAIAIKTGYSRYDRSRQLWGTGFGQLGIVSAISAGANTVVTMAVGTNMYNFRVSQRVDFWNAALTDRRAGVGGVNNQTTEDVGWNITALNRDARTLTFTGQTLQAGVDDLVATDVVLRENVGIAAVANGGNEITGLQAGFQNGNVSAALEGLAFATFFEWQSAMFTNGGVGRNVTEDLMQAAENEARIRSGGMDPSFLGMNFGQERKFLAIGLTNVRHESRKIGLGHTEIDFNGKKFFVDWMAPLGRILQADLSTICRLNVKEWGPLDKGGPERVVHRDEYEWAWGVYENVGYERPNAGVWITDLNEP